MNKQQWMLAAILVLVASFARAQTVEYIHTDALGSPVAVTNASGEGIERTVYEPYGAVINRQVTNGPGYTGHVMDAVTGLNYMQQRYYDPQLGRFLSNDPVTETSAGANFNRYWYANNNPYRYTDPDGEWAQAIGIVVTAGGVACSRSPSCVRYVGSAIAAGVGALTGYLSEKASEGTPDDETDSGDSPSDSKDSAGSFEDTPENQPPFTGQPGSSVRGGTGSRTYGPDGYPETDRDHPHPDEAPPGCGDHCHDWTRPSDGGPPKGPPGQPNPYRGPPREPKPGDPPEPRGPNVPPPENMR